MDVTTSDAPRVRYVREPVARVFPVEEKVPESLRHLKLRTFLLNVLERAFGDRAAVGSDQFVYFSASNPKRCLAPDVFLRLGAPGVDITSWKTWERGTPELAVEIVSPNERPWEDKLADYHEAGFLEVVRYYPAAPPGERLRVWDRLEGDIVERVVEGDRSPSAVLGGHWVVSPVAGFSIGLRLEAEDGRLLPSDLEAEAELREDETRRREEESRRREEESRRREEESRLREEATRRADEAERRVAELEAELARRR